MSTPVWLNDTVQYDKLCWPPDKKPIGSGGFGTVYKVVHQDWGCQVAYKELAIHHIGDRTIRDLKAEAEIHRQLRHQNIVSMLGVVIETGHYGLVLEYVLYGSLETFLLDLHEKTGDRFAISWKLKVKFINDASCAMSYLHNLSTPVIHGDLKIPNLLLGEHLIIKLSDFGLSKWKDYSRSYTRARDIQGTISHIPPENWMDPRLKRKKEFDVYSTGILLWELFAEEEAFAKSGAGMIKELVVTGVRPLINGIPEDVPTSVTNLIESCWHQQPENRPSAAALLHATSELLKGQETEIQIERKRVLRTYNRTAGTTQQSQFAQKLFSHHQTLSDNIRRLDRILPELLQKRWLTQEEYTRVHSQKTEHDRTRMLIDALKNQPVEAYQCFLEALKSTNQHHLYQLLEDQDYVLNLDHKTKVIDYYVFLQNSIAIEGTKLIDNLFEAHVLDQQELENINSRVSTVNKREHLLQLLLRTSEEEYHLFLDALIKSGQRFIAEKLQEQTGPYAYTVERIVKCSNLVMGIAILETQMFVLCESVSPVPIEAYDTNSFTLARKLAIPNSLTGQAMAACPHHRCLYVSSTGQSTYCIIRFDFSNFHSPTTQSYPVTSRCSGLSVTQDHTVLLSFIYQSRVQEYTTDCCPKREIKLDVSIESLRHCVRLSTGVYVACYSAASGPKQHRICTADAEGHTIKAYFGAKASESEDLLDNPFHLAVDSNDNIFVAEHSNGRVMLLSPAMELLATVQTPGEQLMSPSCLYFDEAKHRLYIGELDSQRVVVLKAYALSTIPPDKDTSSFTRLDFIKDLREEVTLVGLPDEKLSILSTSFAIPEQQVYNYSKVNKDDLEKLLSWLDSKDWALQYFDGDDAFHIAVYESQRDEAKQKIEEQIGAICYLPIKFIEPCPTIMELTMNMNREVEVVNQNICYSTAVVDHHQDTDMQESNILCYLPLRLKPNQKIYSIHNGRSALFSGMIRSSPISDTYGMCPGHLYDIPSAGVVVDKLPKEQWNVSISCPKTECSGHDIGKCVAIYEELFTEMEYGCTNNTRKDRIFADIALLKLNDDHCTVKNTMHLDELQKEFKLTLSREHIAKGSSIFFLDQNGKRKNGKVYTDNYNDKLCSPQLFRTLAITCLQGRTHLQNEGDSGCLVIRQLNPEEESSGCLPILGFVLGINRPQHLPSPRPNSLTIANRLSSVLDRRFGAEKMEFIDHQSSETNLSV